MLHKTALVFLMAFMLLNLGCNNTTNPCTAQNTFYVKSDASSGGNGSSWSEAFDNLDSALNAARAVSCPSQIWIATGTYKPTIKYQGGYSGNESNLATFNLPSNVSLYGGFAGNEDNLNDRNTSANPTILSGDLNGDDINSPSDTQTNKNDNAWHVLTAEGATGVILDGFIVRGGYAAGPDLGTLGPKFTLATLDYTHAAGGGLLARYGSKLTLNDMRFEYNATDSANATVRGPIQLGGPALASGGGAIAAKDDDTLVTITNSVFDRNTAFDFGGNGGALSASLEGSFDISHSTFTNSIANRNGGAIHGKDAHDINVFGSIFQNNSIVGSAIGDESGGGIGVINTNVSVSTSFFENNSSGNKAGGGAIVFQIVFDDGEAYNLSVDNSTFKNNLGAAIGGGAIIVFGVTPHIGTAASISGSLFSGNVGGIGGAVYVDSIPTVITRSVFTDNQAWVNGGAVFGGNFGDAIFGVTDLADRKLLSISESSFIQNSIIGIPTDAPMTPVGILGIIAGFQSTVNPIPPAGVDALSPGGAAIATELGGNTNITNSLFISNSAPNGHGGALLVGGSEGFSGTTTLGMNQAYTVLSQSICLDNSATLGGNNTYLLDPKGLGAVDNGVKLVTDGSCP